MPLNNSATTVIHDYIDNERAPDSSLDDEHKDALFLSLQGRRMTERQIRELVKERNVQYRKDKKGRKSRESLDWSWEYVKLKGEGINLGQDYKEHKKYLMNLYENRDYLRLWDALKPYHNMMNKYRKKGEVYIPDQEIFDLYMKTLAVRGEDKRVKQIKSAI